MSEPEVRDRTEADVREHWSEAIRNHPLWSKEGSGNRTERESPTRIAGVPLPMGAAGSQESRGAPSLGRSLAAPMNQEDQSGMQKAMGILKHAVPFVQSVLPLIEGNFGAALINLLRPRSEPSPAAPKVDLVPVENRLNELQKQSGELRSQIAEQNTSLKRVEDQLEMVREATDRNTLEQQELMQDLRAVGNKVKLLGWSLFLLLLTSILLNLVLFLHIKRVLP